jgi:hypothetical protein
MLTVLNERTFDYREQLDELRCRPNEWLQARRVELVREQQSQRIRELATITCVLAERAAPTASDNCHTGVRC